MHSTGERATDAPIPAPPALPAIVHPPDPIAIIGMGCRLPGKANSPEAFWQLLCNGVDAIREIPPDRWNLGAFYDPAPGTPGKTYARWGGFIDGIDQFDAPFFGISPREAAAMDPQQRLLLEAAYEALEDGGQTLERLAGSNTGVFIGISTNDYSQLHFTSEDRTAISAYTATGSAMSIAANRLSYCLDLHGPSLAVDTACSSALVAVHLACRSLWQHESTLALAGGVNVIIRPEAFIGFSQASMLSPEGRCKAFDASGDGFVRSEGVGVVVLKPLAQALADGDPIYAVIRGTAVNQDGRTTGIALPNQEAQVAVLREAYRHAGVAPEQVQYVEAHGTGTAVGDPIETNALGTVLSAQRPAGNVCLIGSVKTNIGHLEAGAGIVGLIKTALALQHGRIPPHLHLREPNPRIDFEVLQLRVPQGLEPWPDTGGGPRYAGVNAFGFGGTNAHIVMSEAPARVHPALPPRADSSSLPCLLPLSARSPEALQALAQAYVAWLQGPSGAACTVQELGYNLSLRRTHHAHRFALVVGSTAELVTHLQAFVAGEARPGSRAGHSGGGPRPRLAFVFGGQGPQWWAMGRQLLAHEPVFRDTIAQCDALLRRYASWSLLAELSADEAHARLHETAIAQPAIFAVQAALAALWCSWGVKPEAVVGHSVGEITAAYVAGILDLETALRVIFHRGRCMDRASSKGTMLGVGITPEEAVALLRPYGERVSLAAINSPNSVTFSGEPEALQAIAETLAQRQVFHSFLRVQYAFHSAQMEPVREELLASLHGLQPRQATTLMVSTVTGQPLVGSEVDAQYWWQNVRQAVRFGPALAQLIDQGYRLFVEVSPHPVLAGYVMECLPATGQAGLVLPSLRREEEERRQMLRSLGALYTAGVPVAWPALYPHRGRLLSLPRYPWQHAAHWHELDGLRAVRLGSTVHPLLGRRLESAAPAWQAVVNRTALPYLWEHQVQGHPVFPATGYFEMALAVARATCGAGVSVIEEMDLHKAFFLPEDGTDALLQTTCDPADGSFSIYGRLQRAETTWTLLASGKVRVEPSGVQSPPVDLDRLRQPYLEEVPKTVCYQRAQARGLHYGPQFQGIAQLWRSADEALGLIHIPESLQTDIEAYLFHPAVLDACLQVALETLDPSDMTVYLPVHSTRVRYYGRPGPRLWSHARCLKQDTETMEGELRIYDEQGQVIVELRGSKSQVVDAVQDETADHWMYEVQWHVKPRSGDTPKPRSVDFVPTAATLEAELDAEAHRLSGQLGWGTHYPDLRPELDQLCAAYIANACRDLGWDITPPQRVTVADLAHQCGVVPQYHRLLRRLLDILAEDGWLHASDGAWVVQRTPPRVDVATTWQSLLQRFPAFTAELTLVHRSGLLLGELLQGKRDPLHVVFPEGSFAIAEHCYQDSPSFKLYNLLVAKAVECVLQHLPAGRHVRVLEIGAGTASLTSYVLPRLPAEQVSYVLTDVSPLFLQRAAHKLREYPCVTTQVLDIERDPTEQGFEAHAFDIILTSDVWHATRELRVTLAHVQRLLASEGVVIAIELQGEYPRRDAEVAFAGLDGWWRFTDTDLRPCSAMLSRQQWIALLKEVGFAHPIAVAEAEAERGLGQSVLIARGPVVPASATQPQGADAVAPVAVGSGKRWLIFADQGGTGEHLAQWLQARGEDSLLVFAGAAYQCLDERHIQVCPDRRADMQRLVHEVVAPHPAGWQGVVQCWSLESPPPEHTTVATIERTTVLGCHSVMHLLQAWTALALPAAPPLWLITRGAQPVGRDHTTLAVTAAPLCGLGRVIQHEHPDLRCTLVDLSPDVSPIDIAALGEELLQGDDENEVALRGDIRYVPRVVRTSLRRFAPQEKPVVAIPSTPVRLEIATPGILDSLTCRETSRRPPGPGEVEMQVAAAALNFRDVLKVMGLYPTDIDASGLLGDECAGWIVAVGDGVTGLQVGDEVVALAPGSLGTFVTTRAVLTVPKPSWLGWNEAATLPIVFLTAYYALHHVGRISRGERVLIHAATGGVGLAAIQVAQQVGAEVFATAGSPEKRAFLQALGLRHVMDSRSLAFAEEIRAVTGGRGVNLVLNSLAGEAIPQGLACLAPYGRFLEIGVRDIYQNRKLGLRAFKNSVSFCAINLAHAIAERPQLIHTLLDEVMQAVAQRHFHPLPHRVFLLREAGQAFRHMAQARHVGKVVVTMHEQQMAVEPRLDETIAFPAAATYLITGGLGGFGLAVAQWLAEHGARHLVLMGRSGAATAEAQQTVQHLERQGVRVVVAHGDVAHEADVDRVLEHIRQTLPPLRGVVHAAVVYDDGILLQLDQERFQKVMAPKVHGAWNLHRLTLHTSLDFFLLFGSFASFLGNPGQGNYVAANAFLDALAYYRRAHHLPALTVSWGLLTDVGHVARHEQLNAYIGSRRVQGFTARQAMDICARLLAKHTTHAGVMRMDWQWLAQSTASGLAPRFALLLSPEALQQHVGSERARLRDVLLATPSADRLPMLEACLADQIASVLGMATPAVDVERALTEMGLDSLMAVELKSRVEYDLGLTLPTVELLRGPSIRQLAQVLLGQLSGVEATGRPAAATAIPSTAVGDRAPEALLEELEHLSEQEVDTLLSGFDDSDLERLLAEADNGTTRGIESTEEKGA